MGNTASPNFSGFQFQSIGKSQSDNQISLLKRLSSVKTSDSNEYDDQDHSTQTHDIDVSQGSTSVPTAAEVDTSSVAISSVPSRRTLFQTLGNNEQVTSVPVQYGPKVDIFGQRFPFVLPSVRPVDSMNSTTVSQSVVGTSTGNNAVDEVVSLPSSSIPISKPPSDLPSIPFQSTISRASSCASNSSHIDLTYPMSTPQSPQQPPSPFVVKSELARAAVHIPSKDHLNFSSLTQGDSSSSSAPTPTSFGPSFAALNEIHSRLLSTFHDLSSESSETIAQASAKLASAFECASRAQNLAQESLKLTQTASSTLVDSLEAGKDSHETADKAISLVETSMKILAAYETKHAKGIAEMKEATERIGGWIDEEQQRLRLTKEAKAKAEKELQAREKKAGEVREAKERREEAQEKIEDQKKEKSANEAQERGNKKKRGPVARFFNLTNDVNHVIMSGPSCITAHDPPTSHAPAALVDATDSLSVNSSFNFSIDASTSALDSLDSLEKADAWIEKLKTIENTARRAREEKEMQMERVMKDKNRQREEYKQAEETRQRQAAEQERQRLEAEQEDRRRKEENERRQSDMAAAEGARCDTLEEEKQKCEAANLAAEKELVEAQLRKKAIEEREQKLRLKLEQEQEQAQAWKQAAIDEQQRRREALQQSQAGRKLGSQRATPVGNIGLPSVPIIPSIPSVVSPTFTSTSTRPFNPSALPKSSVPSRPQLFSSIPTTPNVIANQTVPKLTKKQRQKARKAEALAQQQPVSGNVPLGPTESPSLIASKVTLPTAASGVRQNPTTQSMPLNPDHRTSVSNYPHSPRNNISLGLIDGSVSRSSNSPILHTNSTDAGNILLQSSAPKSPEVRAANMRFVVKGAGAGMDNSTSSDSNANWRERKLAIRKSKPEYDIPMFKNEDDDRDSMKCLRSPAKMTIPVVSHPTPDLSTPLLEATSNPQVLPPAAEGHSRVGNQSRNSSEYIPGDASGAGLGYTPIAPNVAKARSTSAKGVISVPSLLKQPANNPTLTSTSAPAPLQEPTSQARLVTGAFRRPPSAPAPSNSQTHPTSQGNLTAPNTSVCPPPATALSESQNRPVSRAGPNAVASPVSQMSAPIRSLSPIAPNDGGWANVRIPDSASEYIARSGRRGHNHNSPSPNSIGSGRHMSLEGSPFIPRSPPSAIGSPFSHREQTQRDRRLSSSPDQRERSPSRPNRRGNSTFLGYGLDSGRPSNSNGQDIRRGGGRGRTNTPPNRATFKSRSRSPPVTHTGRKRSRVDDDRRDTPPFRQDHYSHQAESISRNGYKNSRRTSYPDSEHSVEAYNESLSPPNSSPTYNDIPTSLESRLSNGYDASGGTSEGFYSSSYDRNDWVLDNRRLSPPFHHQSQPPELPNKRQKLLDPGSADKAPLLSRMAGSSYEGTFKGHSGQAVRGYGRGRGRGRGRGGTSYNSHSHLGPGQRHQQPAKNSLMDRLSY
ncbi:uncharacterized protein C8R40DRAFT_1097661 [Lentinula edodes]|uniref:uncharacterized protein n=1 Tax=Lentinula edodes TaxID=5353 RepID=UPI001E8E1F5F|nr:uncharacterized protein C8R40DRAFT_1097661 [Lentinula edodes]KAH7876569.1 hypothetical protein C8R40DRAFT_1097661 [Lentinula edodes]